MVWQLRFHGVEKSGTELDEAGVVKAINVFTAEADFDVSADEVEAIQTYQGMTRKRK